MVRCLLILAFAGCNQIYGLDSTQLPPDAAVFPVTGRLLHRWEETSGMKEAPLPMTNVVYLSVRTKSGKQDIDLQADGTFTFDRSAADAPYRLEMTVDGDIFELHGSAPTLRFVARSAGRLDASPIDDPLPVRFQRDPSTTKAAVASTGIWSYVETPFLAPGADLDWQSPTNTAGRHGLVDASRGDAFYTLEYASRNSVPENKPYTTLSRAEHHTLVMTSGTAVNLAGPAPIPTPQPCSKLVGAITQEVMRLDAALGAEFTFLADTWKILAIASLDIGVIGQTEIASHTYSVGDIAITPTIHNPIIDSELVVSTGVAFHRYVKHPASASGLFINAAIAHTVPLDCAAAQTLVVPEPPVGIPGNFRLDGVALDRDTTEVTPMGDDVVLTWETVQSGPLDLYNVVLVEVLNEPIFDSTGARVARVYQTSEQRLLIDVAALVRGRYYLLQLTAFKGFPDAKTGDLGALGYPFTGVQVYTSLFRIR